jgi:uncharacterized protein (DUF885 family)
MDTGETIKLRFPLFFLLIVSIWLLASCAPSTPEVTITEVPQVTIAPTVEPTVEPTEEPTKEPTPPPLPATTPDPRTGAEIAAELEGLTLEAFFEESYKQLILRSPETVTYLGLAEDYGMRNDRLDDLSNAFILETQALEKAILDLLRTYDRESLTAEMQISYDVYEWYLDIQVKGHKFMYHDYPFHHYYGSYHERLIELFNNYHPLKNRQDVEDFITRLSMVNTQVDQLLEGLQYRTELGVILPDFIVDNALGALIQYLGTYELDPTSVDIQYLDVYDNFRSALGTMDMFSEEEKEVFKDKAHEAIENSYLPAFFKLFEYLNEIEALATADAGVWKLPDGEDYYAYTLRKETSTNLTPAEVHAIGLAEVARIHEEMRAALVELGYNEEDGLFAMQSRAISDAGVIAGSGIVGEAQALLDEAERRMAELFSLRPQMELVIVGSSTPPASYEPGSLDGSRPGTYKLPTSGGGFPRFFLPTMSYHEAIPGHYYQIELAREMNLPLFRTEILFNGYCEGWALYAERLAWEIGLYEESPYGNLGRLQSELMRAMRLVVDTGIHSLGWTREEALAYAEEAYGNPASHEVDRYVIWPAQATGYGIGMLEILELRQRAMDELGDEFDFSEFHQVVLGSGAMPLEILERVVNDYIEAKLNNR